jgi:hypothetical protein
LAHEHPEFRKDILPLLKEAGCEKLPEGGMRDNCEAKKEEGKGKDKEASANSFDQLDDKLAEMMVLLTGARNFLNRMKNHYHQD